MAATLPVTRMEPSDVAVAGFLARYREPTLSAYRRDLRCFWQWCADHQVEPLAVRRPHLELYLRELEQRGCAPATVSRRLSTVAGLFKYAVIDELVATNPSLAVTRPRVPWEGQHRTVLHPLEFAAVLSAARRHGDTAHGLVALLGMLGLRVSELQRTRHRSALRRRLRAAASGPQGRQTGRDPAAHPGAPRGQSRHRGPQPRADPALGERQGPHPRSGGPATPPGRPRGRRHQPG